MRFVFKLIVRLWFRLRIEGDLRALQGSRALVVAYHRSCLDGILLGLLLPARATVVLAPDDLSHPLVRRLARFVRHEVADLSLPSVVRRMTQALERGGLLVMFPEGRVSTTGSGMKFYDTVAAVAARTGAPLVPVTIDGLAHSAYGRMPGDFSRTHFPRVRIVIHPAAQLSEAAATIARMRRRHAADALAAILQKAAVDARVRATLYEKFIAVARRYGRAARIVEDVRGVEETYGDLLKATLVLGRLGTRLATEREPVGILMPNLSTTVALLLGLSATGRVPAMLNHTAGAEALRSACMAACIGTVITSRQFVETARLYPALDALCDQRIVFIEDLRERFGWRDKLWLAAWAWWWPRALRTVRDPGATAVLLFTSGSEARPKGVALSHDALLTNIEQMRAVIDFSPADRFLNALPMFHSYGLTACTLMPILCGVRLLLYTNPLRYRAIPEIAYQRDCTFLFGTSTFLSHYGREAHPYDFHRVRVVVSGAEKLNSEVSRYWLEKFGLRIFEGYGATECAPVLALNTPLAFRAQTAGRFLPGVEYRLVPVEGIPRGGRLHVRGPNLMQGYLRVEEPGVLQPPQSEIGVGWYDTGDVIDVDSDGYVTVLGRVKRFAKIAGEMVALDSIEKVAGHASPAHRHAAMVEAIEGVGETTVLFTTDPQLTRALLQRSARLLGSQELAVARSILHVAELPVLGSGKTDYVKLRDLAGKYRLELVASNDAPRE